MLDLPLSRLSGGELRRLQLVRLLAESPNFLLLDEPTNDLDIDTIELLEDFISDFSGCVLAVSHDRAFLDGMADSILAFDGSGGIKEYVGRYADYRSIAGDGVAAAVRPVAARGNRDRRVRADPGSVKPLSYAERRELDTLLDEVSLLEDEKLRLEALFTSSSPEPIELARANRRYPELSALIDAKIARWENLASRDRRDS
jgi:ATP-binding cassette subfamily F protein uup